ncbi:uncharacterized protein CTRU02_208514 [Colletotrichum truncatum]|uniref:Uncharacterized protein n=1 Tax=Colletotrichum truncatum TaxID=5467 RepID=A0ACC3YWI7_COLTU|nr:uncharacterized protein CTRU02_10270 [Colletotrichum truncatum]KAF6787474.1 hypothetical protein CTRU02_10270 [Colletotrichum truncatum]
MSRGKPYDAPNRGNTPEQEEPRGRARIRDADGQFPVLSPPRGRPVSPASSRRLLVGSALDRRPLDPLHGRGADGVPVPDLRRVSDTAAHHFRHRDYTATTVAPIDIPGAAESQRGLPARRRTYGSDDEDSLSPEDSGFGRLP